MAWDFCLKDGCGTYNKLKIYKEGQLPVVVHPHPPQSESIAALPFREYLTLNGDGTTFDMRVNGSVNNQSFFVQGNSQYDLYIKSLSVVIADVNASLNNFGNLAPLTNGCRLVWIDQEVGELDINPSIKTNFDFVRLAGGQPSGVNGPLSNVTGNSEGFIPFLDFQYIFGLQWGIRLRRNTLEKLELTVKDDLSVGLDSFNIIAYGIRMQNGG